MVALLAAGVEIGEDPPLAAVVRAVRAQIEGGGPAVARAAQQPGRRGVDGRERGEGGGDGGIGLDRSQQQHPHQHPERAAVRGGAERGLGLAPRERGVGLAAEQRPHAVGAVAGAVQRGAQGVGGGGGDLGQHAPILADAPSPARRRGAPGSWKATFLSSGAMNVAFLTRAAPPLRWGSPPIGGAVLQLAQDPDADALLDRDPLALLIGMLLDQQFPMERAFAGPAGLARRLGVDRLDARALAEYDPEALAALFTGPPALHRYPAAMAGRVQALAALLVDHYDGDAAGLWRDVPDGATLLRRIKALPGFGAQKAQIFVALLGKQRGVTPPGWREAAGAYGDDGSFRSVADVVDGASLVRVREFKQAAKAQKKAAATT